MFEADRCPRCGALARSNTSCSVCTQPVEQRTTVFLTDSAPISIVESAWPEIAKVRTMNAPTADAATELAWVRVRKEHNHTSVWLVHGVARANHKEAHAGYIVKDEAGLTDAIHKVCAVVGIEPQDVFNKLPVREW